MDHEILIKAEGISKKFCRDLKKSLWYGMKDFGNELIGKRYDGTCELRPDEFWAVKGINFEVKRGECLGLIGPNGAGKTTLLRMLNGLIKPNQGRIEIKGRTGALIALGAGFNPILSGRENIYVNAAVLGLTKQETEKKIDEIIAFAELQDFIDMPVQSYSSGMQVRLGFSIAGALEPDILILDEVLAVGDAGFRTKCYNRIYELAERTAIIFVSHSMHQISRLSTKVACLDKGTFKLFDSKEEGISHYNNSFKNNTPSWQIAPDVQITSTSINNEPSRNEIALKGDERLKATIQGRFPDTTKHLEITLTILSSSGEPLSQINNRFTNSIIKNQPRKLLIEIDIPQICIGSGNYLLSLAVVDADTNRILFWAPTSWNLFVENHPYVPTPTFLKGSISTKNME